MPSAADYIRAALETAVAGMSPALATAYENSSFMLPGTDPYQRLTTLFNKPRNPEMSASWEEIGIFQIMLSYPQGDGPGAATSRAGLIRETFRRGRTFYHQGQAVLITETPEIAPGFNDGDRFLVPVRVPFRAPVNVA